MWLNLPSTGRSPKAGCAPPARANRPRPPTEHGARHQQNSHRSSRAYIQISEYRGSRRSPSASHHHALLGLLSLAPNRALVSGALEHDPPSGRRHPRLPARYALFGEVEGCVSQHHHLDAFPRRTNMQFLLAIFVPDRERVDMCTVQVLVVRRSTLPLIHVRISRPKAEEPSSLHRNVGLLPLPRSSVHLWWRYFTCHASPR